MHGIVVRVDKDEVLVDIGYKSEGVIPTAELSIRRSVNPADEVSLGEEIDALVLTKEDAEGRLILSKKRARFELAWKRIEGAAESGEPVDGKVIEVVKGGLILDLGVRGFLPASLVDIRRVQDLDEFLGQELRCKVIELNRSRNNVVLSRRAVLEEERKDQRQRILDQPQPGRRRRGTDLQHRRLRRVRRPRRHGRPDPHLRALVVARQPPVRGARDRPDGQRQGARHRPRAPAHLARPQADAGRSVAAGARGYKEGDVVDGKVTKVVTFGAFVEILPGVEGLVHISELAQHHVENPREVVSQGQDVKVLILEVDAERRRLSLSMKRVEGQEDGDGGGDGSHARPPNLGLSEEVFAEGAAAPAELDRRPPRRRRSSRAEADAPRLSRGGSRSSRSREGSRSQEAEPSRSRCRAVQRRSRASLESEAADEPQRPLNVAITGGIGAGKSEALKAFARHGAATISSDEIVHELIEEDDEVRAALLERFGTTQRADIAEVVFADRDELAWLEALLHPRVVGALPRVARAADGAARGDRGAAPVRDRGRRALRQGRRDHGAEGAARGAARADARRPRDAAARRQGEDQARGLLLRQHGLARGARRVRRRSWCDDLDGA